MFTSKGVALFQHDVSLFQRIRIPCCSSSGSGLPPTITYLKVKQQEVVRAISFFHEEIKFGAELLASCDTSLLRGLLWCTNVKA